MSPTLAETIASLSYVSWNGVFPVGVLVIVLYAHSMLGTSSGHIPFAPSTCPLAWGRAGEELWFLIPNYEQKSWKESLSNCFPLSETKTLEIPYLQMICLQTKLRAFFSVMVARASTFTHFVKQSMPTIRNFSCCTAIGNGPMMSNLHWANGHGAVIRVNALDGCLMILLNLWHLSQILT